MFGHYTLTFFRITFFFFIELAILALYLTLPGARGVKSFIGLALALPKFEIHFIRKLLVADYSRILVYRLNQFDNPNRLIPQ